MTSHRIKLRTAITFLLCALMSACTGNPTIPPASSNPPATPQPTERIVSETKTPAVISATVKPSPTLTPTIQFTHEPSSTPLLARTAPPSRPTQTPDLQRTATEQAYTQKSTQIASFPVLCDNYDEYGASVSPTGNWLAISCGGEEDNFLTVENKTGKQWTLHFKDYLPEGFANEGMNKGSLTPVHWTSDDAYLYFESYVYVDAGGGICFYGFGSQGVYRITVDTGEITSVLPPITAMDGYDFTFSPDWSKLAYNDRLPTILDLRTGENIPIDGTDGVVGDMTWSPDGSHLAFATCYAGGDPPTVTGSALKIYSLETHQSTTILKIENQMILIEPVNGKSQLKIVFFGDHPKLPDAFFDWPSEQLITPTFTPTP